MNRTRVAIPLAVLLGACASSGDAPPGDRSFWGGIVEERIEPPAPLTGRLTVPTPSVAPYPTREFTEEEKAFFEAGWNAFKKDDPRWPEYRDAWMQGGPEAVGVLAENLYRALVASRAKGALHLAAIARKELVMMGEGAVPILVGGLAVRAVKAADGTEIVVGQEVLHDVAEALSLVGAPAVPGLLDIAGCGEPALASEAIYALGNIADPRSEGVLVALAADPNPYTRAAAVRSLRRFGTPAARDRMVASLEDADVLVAERAAEALVGGKHREALPGVVDVLDRAAVSGSALASRTAAWVLQSLTGKNHGLDAAAWRAAIREP